MRLELVRLLASLLHRLLDSAATASSLDVILAVSRSAPQHGTVNAQPSLVLRMELVERVRRLRRFALGNHTWRATHYHTCLQVLDFVSAVGCTQEFAALYVVPVMV